MNTAELANGWRVSQSPNGYILIDPNGCEYPEGDFLTVSQAAEARGLSTRRIRVLASEGRLDSVKRGSIWLVKAAAVMFYKPGVVLRKQK